MGTLLIAALDISISFYLIKSPFAHTLIYNNYHQGGFALCLM